MQTDCEIGEGHIFRLAAGMQLPSPPEIASPPLMKARCRFGGYIPVCECGHLGWVLLRNARVEADAPEVTIADDEALD